MIALAKKLTVDGKLSGQATREQDLRSFLGQFNFGGDMVKQAVGSMSGGEKARLVLCMLVWQRPNLLLMDEPTNHLDLATREALSMALNEFEGTVMLVSHDRALLRAVCDEFWMVSRGGVEPFDGDLDDYQKYLLEESKRLRAEAMAISLPAISPKVLEAPPAVPKTNPSQIKSLQKELAQVELQMETLQTEQDQLHTALSQTSTSTDLAQIGKRLKVIEGELLDLETNWLALTERIEA
jgi:ATP-binding cassette subfamily F protein 3